jgi:hypothetical protein
MIVYDDYNRIIYTLDDKNVHTIDGHQTKHRTNGPASYWNNTNLSYWYLFGEYHRYYGPANTFDYPWFLHGKLIK